MDDDKVIEPTMAQKKYGAFISYSHVDAATVAKLHKQLEAYRLPKGLGKIDALNASNASKSGLGKVFRDREDLSAAENLSDAVTDALGRSQVLVVVCSPEAKASRWVSQEIAYFREHCPGLPILAAIVRGEPAEAFPEALTQGGTEPLAADLRKEGDGWKLGFLKVVAGIAGVPLDALVQRDSQRQMRRVMAVTGVTALVAVAMGVMTTLAIQARDEAQEQRGKAESLVAYMMNDLREDLRRVGSIETMAGVSSEALDYYKSEKYLDTLSAESLLLRAEALHGLGQDLLQHKDADKTEVQSLFEESYRTTSALLENGPDDPERVFQHAQSAYWVGQSHYYFRKWEKVDEYWSEYLDLATRLDALENGAIDARKEVGFANGNLCTLALHRTDKRQRALSRCQAATDVFTRLAQQNPDDASVQSTLANRYGWLADAHKREGDMATAITSYRRQHTIVSKLYETDPRDASRIDQLMRAKMTLAEALNESGAREEVPELLAGSQKLADEMIRRDPQNQYWKDWLDRLAKFE